MVSHTITHNLFCTEQAPSSTISIKLREMGRVGRLSAVRFNFNLKGIEETRKKCILHSQTDAYNLSAHNFEIHLTCHKRHGFSLQLRDSESMRQKNGRITPRVNCSAHRLFLPIVLVLVLRPFVVLLVRIHRVVTRLSLLRGPLHSCAPPFRHVYEPRHETPQSAENKQDRERLPVVTFLVDYRLDHVRPNN